MTIPAAWLPQAAQPFTVILEHEDFDTLVCHVNLARDWESRGQDYIVEAAGCDRDSGIVAMFPGHLKSVSGHAVPE